MSEAALAHFAADREAVRAELARLCETDEVLAHVGPVGDAIRYSILGPGKLLRPVLVMAAYRAAGGRDDATSLAAALEVVHAYSLVHDDLPCMDDDAVRRGRPTTHRVYGPAVAAVAGVAMVPLAVCWAVRAAAVLGLPGEARGAIVRELMRASGARGMVGGQLLDLEAEGRALTLDELEHIHAGKTGALMRAATRVGALAAACDTPAYDALDRFGEALGLAFQIADDVLDATATSEQIGKTAGRDAALRKTTFPTLLGVDGALRRAHGVVEGACTALAASGLLTDDLRALARFAVERTH
ncbi:MAG TPA: farnesyl diphosphate synthase [Gemmatimonadaceae bacterium]|nr:farnesyl diphosphate synthase [Gemmatimonadaceae bacterium]